MARGGPQGAQGTVYGLHLTFAGDVVFVLGVWIATRALIVVALLTIPVATAISVPARLSSGLERLTMFDGGWYALIVHNGYAYVADGKPHDLAFFPLYPSLVWVGTQLKLSFAAAALIINNVTFLAMLFVVNDWVKVRGGPVAARWTVATLCCCPLSLFGSTAYSEGLFLLLSAAALWAFDRGAFSQAVVWGALASATRLPGIALAAAFTLAPALDRRPPAAWLATIAPLAGVVAFATYSWQRFGDPLAFVRVQSAWRTHLGLDILSWSNLFGAGIARLPLLHLLAAAAALAFWFARGRWPLPVLTLLALVTVEAERWAWNGSEYIMLLTIVAGATALVFRKHLGTAATTYTLVGISVIACAGVPVSVDRLAFGLVSVSFALALAWQRIPALGFAVLIVMMIDLFEFTQRFVTGAFVA